jgi:hypothetical protein
LQECLIDEPFEMKSALSSLLGLGLLTLSGCDDVSTADQAIAVAERACADTTHHGQFALKPDEKLAWLAYPQSAETGKGDGWLVAASYDASRPGNGSEPPAMAYVRIEFFVPRNGKPGHCIGMVD